MNLCHAKAVIACHELVEGGKIGPVPGYVPIYPKSCKPEDQIAAMNAEELIVANRGREVKKTEHFAELAIYFFVILVFT